MKLSSIVNVSKVSPDGEVFGKLNFTAQQLHFCDSKNFTNKKTRELGRKIALFSRFLLKKSIGKSFAELGG